jgi:hypothetical protein
LEESGEQASTAASPPKGKPPSITSGHRS